MNNGYFEVNDKLLEANKVSNKFIKGKRFLLGFSLDTDISVNGTAYRKIRGLDIDINAGTVILSKKQDGTSTKVKVPEFTSATIDYVGGDVTVETK